MLRIVKSMARFRPHSFRRAFSGKDIIVRKLTMGKATGLLCLNPAKPRLEERENFKLVKNSGYVGLEFYPIEKKEYEVKYNFSEKKTFFLNFHTIGEILQIRTQPLRASYEVPEGPLTFSYQMKDRETLKQLQINFVNDSILEISYKELNDSQETFSQSIQIESSELVVIQQLLRYSIPYILGWNFLEEESAYREYPKSHI